MWLPAPAAERGPIPDFSSHDVGWIFGVGDYIPIPGEPSPTRNDPAHPYINNNQYRATGAQPTYRVADLSNPNIKPWAKEIMQRENRRLWQTPEAVVEETLRGNARGKVVVIPGWHNKVAAALLRTLPEPIVRRIIAAGSAKYHLDGAQ